jgi:transposase
LPTANGFLIVTTCCGPSLLFRSSSVPGDPIVNAPAGTTTISGQFSHSRNVSFGFSARSCASVSGAMFSLTSGTMTAGICCPPVPGLRRNRRVPAHSSGRRHQGVALVDRHRDLRPLTASGSRHHLAAELLLAYVEQCLVPTVKPKDIVVVDNLVSHKVAGVAGAIEAADATLRYLPQYSPDLNPIEMRFSKFNAYSRKLAQRTVPGIRHAIRSFLSSLNGQECANYL